MAATKSSRIISGRYPAPGTSAIADAIRLRRGPARGITPLDAALLHVPPVADGWNSLLGAIRTKGELPADVRELMILRVAALNHAAFEWIHHEHVGRANGLTTAQLYIVRDTSTPLPPSTGILSALQVSALMFADASTKEVKVGKTITEELMKDLKAWALQSGLDSIEEKAQDLLVEAAAIVASYNMVSRFLVSLDVGGMSDDDVPWPIDRKEYFISVPSPSETTHAIHATTLISSPSSPWIVFANSLLTDASIWGYLIPYYLSDSPDKHTGRPRTPYNILIHSQRGHGLSSVPPQVDKSTQTTIQALASDIANLLTQLNIQTPVHALVGVSQGGAAALAFSQMYPGLTRSIVACDTAAKTPAGNREAWAARVAMVYGDVSADAILREGFSGGVGEREKEYAMHVGMRKLAEVTVPRWFPVPSKCGGDGYAREERAEWVKRMVQGTSVNGFIAGAAALSDYDLLGGNLETNIKPLFDSSIERALLVAGSLDGGGKVGSGLRRLGEEWNVVRGQNTITKAVEYVEIEGAGHLPMIDETERFAEALTDFLGGL